MNKYKSLFILFVLTLSCKSQQSTVSRTSYLQLEKTPCYGTCPAYTLTLYSNLAEFNGKRYVEPLGLQSSELNKSQREQIKTFLNSSVLWDSEREYSNTEVVDGGSTIYLRLRNGDKEKSIMIFGEIPAHLEEVLDFMNDIQSELEWEQSNGD